MSWLRQEPSVVLEDNDDEITSTRSRPTMEEVQARNRALQALLSTEQEAHSQSRAALDVSRRQEKESLYKLQLETARSSKLQDELESQEQAFRNRDNQRSNLEIALEEAQGKIEQLEKQSRRDLREAATAEQRELDRLNEELSALRSSLRRAEDGERACKNECSALQREVGYLEQQQEQRQQQQQKQIPNTAAQHATSGEDQNDGCQECRQKEDELAALQSQLAGQLEVHAALHSAKKDLEANLVNLTNQQSALVKSSQEQVRVLRDELEMAKDELECVRQENKDLEEMAQARAEHHKRDVARKDEELVQLATTLEEQRRRHEALPDEIVLLEQQNDELREELQNATADAEVEIAQLNSHIRNLEMAYQTTNSDLLSSRSALVHTESKLSSLESRLNALSQRSYDDDYVMSLRGELEDETKFRVDLEARLRSAKEEERNGDDDSDYDASLETAILSNQLTSSKSALSSSQKAISALGSEQESLQHQIGQLHSQLHDKDEEIGSLTSDLETLKSINDMKDHQLLNAREELAASRATLQEKEDELLLTLAELESLKRDAKALRDQLVALHSPKKPPSPPRNRHYRTNSAPFSPSTLRHASFPPTSGSMLSNDLSSMAKDRLLASLTEHPFEDGTGADGEQPVVLVSRLRQERDEAISQLAYYLLEHRITAEVLQADIESSKAEKEALRADIEDMVGQLMQSESTAQRAHVLQEKLDGQEAGHREMQKALDQSQRQLQDLELKYETLLSESTGSESNSADTGVPREKEEEDVEKLQQHVRQLEEEVNTIKELASVRLHDLRSALREQDELRESLDVSTRELEGARNAVLAFRQKDEELRTMVSPQAHAAVIEELERSRLELEGARNLAVELAGRREALAEEKDQVEASMKERLSALSTQVATEAHSKLAIEEECAALVARCTEAQADLASQEQQVHCLILALLQSTLENRGAQRHVQELRASSQEASLHESTRKADDTEVQELRDEVGHLEEQLRDAQNAADRHRADLVKAIQACEEAVAETQSLQEKLLDLQALRVTLDREMEKLRHSEKSLLEKLDASGGDKRALERELDTLKQEVTAKNEEIADLHDALARSEETVHSLHEELRIAQEEGSQLVNDFNLLSAELEKRQNDDETRTVHSEETQRRLAEAVAQTQELSQKSDEAIATIRDLQERVKELETELENKQVEVEETDDRYLASLKTVKKQELALDKLKVRIEALQRANALLNKAMPASAPNVLAPTPSSAKKRGLPQDFVAPDPGPAAIVSAPAFRSTSVTKAAAGETMPERLKMLPENAVKPSSGTTQQLTAKSAANTPTPASSMAIPADRPRRPLAAVQPQATSQASVKPDGLKKGSTEPLKPASLPSLPSNRPPFRPTSGLSQKPLGSRSAISSKVGTQHGDSKSLLAALQALKAKPAAT